jgi:serine protease DegS
MVHLARLSWQRFTRLCFSAGSWFVVFSLFEPAPAKDIWRAKTPTGTNLIGTPLTDGKNMVSVLVGQAFDGPLVVQSSNGKRICDVVGFDPTSRLLLMRAQGEGIGESLIWHASISQAAGMTVFGNRAGSVLRGATQGWVYQVRDKILPLGLLMVSFESGTPEHGSAVVDEQGRVLGLVFESAGPNAVYALPSPAVLRVQEDLATRGKLIRGWLGTGLNSRDSSPRITKVQPNSPALHAGIRPGDVLTAIANKPITSYGQAVDAFFYLRPSMPVSIRIQRGNQSISLMVTPMAAPES